MLVDECEKGNVTMRLRSEVLSVVQDDEGFTLELNGMTVGTKNWLSLPVGFPCRVWGQRRLVIKLPNSLV